MKAELEKEPYDGLACYRNYLIQKGMPLDVFRTLSGHLEEKILGLFPDLDDQMMRNSILTWLSLIMKTKSFKVSVIHLSKEGENKIKCLFCDNYPITVIGYENKASPRSLLYFVCWDHCTSNADITVENRKIVSGIHSIYRLCVERNFIEKA